MNVSRFVMVLGLIMMGVVSRLIPHPPNFTSINAIALLSIFYLEKRSVSFVAVYSALLLGDMILGFHSTMLFVYMSFGLTIFLGHAFKNWILPRYFPLVCFANSILFFLVVNFGVWLKGFLYPQTFEGLGMCYLAALPFLIHQILGDFAYGSLLFGSLYFRKMGTLKIVSCGRNNNYFGCFLK